MTVRYEVELKFDPARRTEIIQAAQKAHNERVDPDEIWDLEGNQLTIKDTEPDDLQEALMVLVEIAIEDDERLHALNIEFQGLTGSGDLEERKLN